MAGGGGGGVHFGAVTVAVIAGRMGCVNYCPECIAFSGGCQCF